MRVSAMATVTIWAMMACLAPTSFSQRPVEGGGQDEALRLQGDLVEVPVIVRNRQNQYIPDLKKEDFILYEDGIEQHIAFFAHTEEPFHVALLIDTSGSTEEELPRIRQAALTFIGQLHPRDEVMIVSFDDEVRVISEFTSDRGKLARALAQLQSGESTRLFDAVDAVVRQWMNPIAGRKALILFTDGVDTASREATAEGTRRHLEESNVLVYSIRYDTREAVRRRLRRPKKINIGTLPPPGPQRRPRPAPAPPNPPTGRWPDPSSRPFPRPRRWPMPNPYPTPYPDRYPTPQPPSSRVPYPTPAPPPAPPPRMPRRRPQPRPNDPLDMEYQRGEQYLWDLADRTGGTYYEANLLQDLPRVFGQIAEELRHQYTLGYYPTSAGDGRYHRIRVRVNRPGAYVRARPGYRAL